MAPMRLRRTAAATLGLLALVPALAACGDDGAAIAVGDVVEARQDDQFVGTGTESIVALPIGRLEISAGKPTTQLTADDTHQLEAIEAPAGSAFVPITWQYDAGTFGDYADYADTDANPTIDLVADKASYRIPAPETSGRGAESFYVLVSGDGEDASLAVDFDGVTQTVVLGTGERDEGRAAPLYDLRAPSRQTTSCTAATKFTCEGVGRLPDYECKVGKPFRLPYAGGAWAEDGGTWYVVTLKTTLRRFNQASADLKSGGVYVAAGVDSSFKLGKLKPTKVIVDKTETVCPDGHLGGCSIQYLLVFGAGKKAPGTLRLAQTYDMALAQVFGEGDPAEELQITSKASIKLR